VALIIKYRENLLLHIALPTSIALPRATTGPSPTTIIAERELAQRDLAREDVMMLAATKRGPTITIMEVAIEVVATIGPSLIERIAVALRAMMAIEGVETSIEEMMGAIVRITITPTEGAVALPCREVATDLSIHAEVEARSARISTETTTEVDSPGETISEVVMSVIFVEDMIAASAAEIEVASVEDFAEVIEAEEVASEAEVASEVVETEKTTMSLLTTLMTLIRWPRQALPSHLPMAKIMEVVLATAPLTAAIISQAPNMAALIETIMAEVLMPRAMISKVISK
jgi:hypothetical protein